MFTFLEFMKSLSLSVVDILVFITFLTNLTMNRVGIYNLWFVMKAHLHK